MMHLISAIQPEQPAWSALLGSKAFSYADLQRSHRPDPTSTSFSPSPKPLSTATTTPEIKDKVTLSAATQATSLYRQGMTVSQIAALVGQSVTAIDAYLGTTQNTAATDPLQALPALLSKLA